MARGKVQMRRIENPVHRQVTFCKRRAGLLKKAKELSVLCDAEIGVLIFSPQGKLYELSTHETMQGLIEKYTQYTGGTQPEQVSEELSPNTTTKEEVNMLKHEIQSLQKVVRFLFGGEVGTMGIDDLNVLEKQLENWIYNIRSTKMDIMVQEIQALQKKEGILKAANNYLQEKIEEQVEVVEFAPITPSVHYPLTIQNEMYHF